MNPLDNPETYSLDRSGMFRHVERLGDELEIAWAAHGQVFASEGQPQSLIVAGMGGSASAADYFAALVRREAIIPVEVVRDYDLPARLGPDDLVVVVSYSGTTDEALSCYAQAIGHGATTLAVTAGGELASLANAHGRPLCLIDYDAPPRAALAHTLAPLLGLADAIGATPLSNETIAGAVSAHRRQVVHRLGRPVAAATNPAKRCATDIASGATPLIFAAEYLGAAGQRGKNQFAENAKTLAVFEQVPEGSHNTVVTLEMEGGPAQVGLAFDSPLLHPGNRKRIDVIGSLFAERGFGFYCVELSGHSLLADLWEATAFLDFTSCYLAMLRGVDPTPTPNLSRVRSETSGVQVSG